MAVLTRRELNRATLDRQLLLRRHDLPPLAAVERIVGLQAQTTHTWYVGLFDRLAGVRPETIGELLTTRQAVRIVLMRSTIHLVSAADALALRGALQPATDRLFAGNWGKRLGDVDPTELRAAARAVLDGQPRTFSELGRLLAPRWPDTEPAALAQAARAWLPLAQVPPRGVWGRSGLARHAPVDTWLGGQLRDGYPPADLIRRYLGAFGPASVADAQTWSGLTRLGEVFDALRPELAVLRDEAGVELFDLPDAPRPGADVPAPPRFLYDYDNLLLSHADRTRVITADYRREDFDPYGPVPRLFLLDGFTAGTWTLETKRTAGRRPVSEVATLAVRPFRRLSARATEALAEEGARLLGFVAAGATHDIQFIAPE